jgi:hypothetical protein
MRILLLGASGYVGGALWAALPARHTVLGQRPAGRAPAGRDTRHRHKARAALDRQRLRRHRRHVRRDRLPFPGEHVRPDEVRGGGHAGRADHLVVRIPLVYGRSPWTDRFMARFAGPRDRSGVLHLGGAEVMTRVALMSGIVARLGLPARVVGVREDEMDSGLVRPRRLVLRSIHHSLLGPSLEESLAHPERGGPPRRRHSGDHGQVPVGVHPRWTRRPLPGQVVEQQRAHEVVTKGEFLGW